jgi:hypothetical protein
MVLDLTGASKQPQGQTSHICFLCKSSFSSRDALTVHCKAMHVDKGTFNQDFLYPECRRSGKPDHLITNTSSWSSHGENGPRRRKCAEFAHASAFDPICDEIMLPIL